MKNNVTLKCQVDCLEMGTRSTVSYSLSGQDFAVFVVKGLAL